MSLTFRRLSLLALLALLAAFVPMARPARAAIRQVTTTADSGAGSLRQAMLDAVAGDTINFANGGTPWTISPLSPLPPLDNGNVTIDGGLNHNVVINGGLAGDSHGFTITSANNTIKGLVIQGFRYVNFSEATGGSGIYIAGSGATGNRVLGCYIGTDAAGSTAVGNERYGVLISGAASANTIGGASAGEPNVISGNGASGQGANVGILYVSSSETGPVHDNTIIGNNIGTNAGGTAEIGGSGNPTDGVLLEAWAQNNVVQGNIISGHDASASFSEGVAVASTNQGTRPNLNNRVIGNYIGTNVNGTGSIPNATGVRITRGDGTQIGSAAAFPSNIISGNIGNGVIVEGNTTTNTLVAGNWIGLDRNGAADSNGGVGVQIGNNATTTTVGPKNVISANSLHGIQISIGASTIGNNVIKGNYIGTDTTGSTTNTSLRNAQLSIWLISGQQNTIGGSIAGDGNVIAIGGALAGINISSSAASNNTVKGNFIGVNSTGTEALLASPTGGAVGLLLDGGTTNNMIGGPTLDARNIVSGNYHGIQVKDAGTNGNTIQYNYIGTDINNSGAIGNKGNGIRVLSGPTDLKILNNVVANNAVSAFPPGVQGGIYVSGAIGVKISQTATRNNTGDGINLVSANGGIQPPGSLSITGNTLTGNAPACGGCTIEVFTSPTQDNGEGPRYLTSGTADGSGNFTIAAAGCDQFLTATATNASGNTSIFANPMVGNCAVSQANVQLDPATPNAQTVAPGVTATYQHTLHNTGTAPGNFTITNSAAPAGWTVVVNPTSVSLAGGATTTINVSVTPPANAAAGAQAATTITASVGSQSDAETDTTTVAQTFGVTISPDRSSQVTPPGTIDYAHTITNTGNGNDTIVLSTSSTNPGVTVSFPDGPNCTLGPGASCTLRVRITVAAGATGADTTTVEATSQGNPAISAQPPAKDTTTIVTAAVPSITDATPNPQSILPGNTATFIHTVTNIGNIGGQFTVSLLNSAPPGWTFLYTPTTSFTLAPGASQTVEVTISALTGANAPDAGTSATAQVQVMSSDNALDTTNDTATALLRPAFTFSPATQPTVNNAVPGRTAIFTHTLTNDGNGTDTFNITVTPPGGWTADPIGPITLARNASQQVVVRVHVPNGQGAGSYPFDVTAQTTSTPQPAAQTRQDTVVVVGAAVPQLSPAQMKNATPPLPTTVSFTHILTNTGNQAGTFSLSAAVQGAPAGWSAAPNQPSCSLVQNASCTFTVNVTVPAGAVAGDQAVLVTASIAGPPPASDSVLDIVKVPAIPGLTFTPGSLSDTGDPGEQVTYIHTLTNTGNGDDTYTVTLQVSPGWTATANPLVVSVPRNQSRPVTVTVTVPTGVLAGTTGIVTATATSRLAPYPSASVVDQTTINAVPGAELIPNTQTLGANPTDTEPDTVIFRHTLRNSGSVALTYALSKSDTLAWTSILTPTQVGPLQPGQTVTVTLSVTAPAGTPIGSPPNVTTIQVRDQASPASPPLETATDTTIVGPKYGVLIAPTDNYATVLPGASKVYTHTLTNIGAGPDTFTFGTVDFHGWSVFVAPASVDLAKDASTVISVTVQVPTNILSDTLDLATLTVFSEAGNTPIGNAYEHTLVGQIVGADFSPNSSRAIAPGSTVQFIHTLVNTGNGLDTFVFSTTATLDWPVTVTPASVTLAANETFPSVTVQVQVPAGALPDDVDRITIKAISQSDPSVAPEVRDLVRNPPQPERLEHNLYLPIIKR